MRSLGSGSAVRHAARPQSERDAGETTAPAASKDLIPAVNRREIATLGENMAVNKPVGDNARKGAAKKRTQLKTKVGGVTAFTTRSKTSGEFIAVKTPAKFAAPAEFFGDVFHPWRDGNHCCAQRVATTTKYSDISPAERLAALRVPTLAKLPPSIVEHWTDEAIAAANPDRMATYKQDAEAVSEAEAAFDMVRLSLQQEAGL
jgi:hypothetical protein